MPGDRNAGTVVPGLVELVDLYPTLVELCELPNPAHALEGSSFRPLLEDPNLVWKSAAFSESKREGYHGRTLRTLDYRYTEWTPASGDRPVLAELYNLGSDPMEYMNLADETEEAVRVEELSQRLVLGWRGALPPGHPE
jgi:arylsulfatase A-like enzyme